MENHGNTMENHGDTMENHGNTMENHGNTMEIRENRAKKMREETLSNNWMVGFEDFGANCSLFVPTNGKIITVEAP